MTSGRLTPPIRRGASMADDFDDYYDDYDEGPPCPLCDGWKTVNCYCGGDQCYCENYGEKDCPLCYGEGVASPERAEAYLAHDREMAAVMRKFWEERKAKDAERAAKKTEKRDG